MLAVISAVPQFCNDALQVFSAGKVKQTLAVVFDVIHIQEGRRLIWNQTLQLLLACV